MQYPFRLLASVAAFTLAACSSAQIAAPTAELPQTAGALRDAAPVAIYSNIGKGKRAFRCCIAWTIGGPQSKIGKQWLGAPFVPSSNAVAKTIVAGLTWSLGPNDRLRISLAPDRRGAPGQDLSSAEISGALPKFNHCCTLQTATLAKPVSLQSGVRYWVVIRTTKATAKTVDNWQNNSTNAGGLIATDNGKGWGSAQVGKGLPAFAVFGD
jgi:hypothetical protein